MNLINFIFNNSTYLAVVVVPGRIFVDLGFLPVVMVAVGRAAIPVPPTKFHCGTISGGPWLRIGSKVFGIKVFEVVVLCDSEFASSLVSASVTIDRCSESLIGVLVMLSTDAHGMVSLMTDIGGAGAAAGETLLALPVESSDTGTCIGMRRLRSDVSGKVHCRMALRYDTGTCIGLRWLRSDVSGKASCRMALRYDTGTCISLRWLWSVVSGKVRCRMAL